MSAFVKTVRWSTPYVIDHLIFRCVVLSRDRRLRIYCRRSCPVEVRRHRGWGIYNRILADTIGGKAAALPPLERDDAIRAVCGDKGLSVYDGYVETPLDVSEYSAWIE